jgi:hypothetical protein
MPAKIPSMETLELDDLFAILREIEDAARSPANITNMARANVLALSMAKNAPTGGIANIAMQLVTVTNELRRSAQPPRFDDAALNKALSRLRLALQEERSRPSAVELQPRG